MFLNPIFLGFFPVFPSSFRGCQEVSDISFVFCNLCHFLFFPSPFLKFPFAWEDLFLMAFPWSLAAAGATLAGMWIENYQKKKNSWKATNLISSSFFWNLCTSISEKPSNHFTVSLEFLGASSDKDSQSQGVETLTLKTQRHSYNKTSQKANSGSFILLMAYLSISKFIENKRCFQFLATQRPSKQNNKSSNL